MCNDPRAVAVIAVHDIQSW